VNIERLKFAWARGARIQHYGFHDAHDGQQWWVCSISWLGYPGHTSFRIHPDDAHLEYGPLSSALREQALRMEYEHSTMLLTAQCWIEQEFGLLFDLTPDFDCDCFALMCAEYLADQGL